MLPRNHPMFADRITKLEFLSQELRSKTWPSEVHLETRISFTIPWSLVLLRGKSRVASIAPPLFFEGDEYFAEVLPLEGARKVIDCANKTKDLTELKALLDSLL